MAAVSEHRGPYGRASVIGAQPDEVAAWLIETSHPVAVAGDFADTAAGVRPMMLRSRFLMVTCGLDWVPGGGYPRREGDTHDIRVSPIPDGWSVDRLSDSLPPTEPGWVMRAAFPGTEADALLTSSLIASALTAGELPMQGRHLALAFHRGVRLTALAVIASRERAAA